MTGIFLRFNLPELTQLQRQALQRAGLLKDAGVFDTNMPFSTADQLVERIRCYRGRVTLVQIAEDALPNQEERDRLQAHRVLDPTLPPVLTLLQQDNLFAWLELTQSHAVWTRLEPLSQTRSAVYVGHDGTGAYVS